MRRAVRDFPMMFLVNVETYHPRTKKCHPVKAVMCSLPLIDFQQEMEYLHGYVAVQSIRQAPVSPTEASKVESRIALADAIKAAPPSSLTVKAHEAVLCALLYRGCAIQSAAGTSAATFLINDVFALLNDQAWTLPEVQEYRPDFVEACSDIVALRAGGYITAKHAKEILLAVWQLPYLTVADYILSSKLLEEADESAIKAIIADVIEANPKIVGQFKSGKTNVAGFFVGQTMKALGGKADPKKIQELVAEALTD